MEKLTLGRHVPYLRSVGFPHDNFSRTYSSFHYQRGGLMRRRTLPSLLVQSSLLGAVALTTGIGVFEAKVIAQAPPYKQMEVKLKPDKVVEKGREKSKAASGKTEKLDLSPLDEYYRDYLIPQLTQSIPDLVNVARREILQDIDTIEKNKELSAKFNASFIAQMKELAGKDKNGKTFAPHTRINAAFLLGRLNSEVTNNLGKPEARVQQSLLDFIEQKENEGLTSSALSTLSRHIRAGAVNEAGLNKFVSVLQSQLAGPAPVTRDPDSHDYLTEQIIQCLTDIVKLDPEKGPGKLAAAALTPALLKIIDEQKSEWLVEAALVSFGTLKTVNLSPEEVITLEKAIAKFVKQSLKDWKKRITSSSGLTGGMGGGTGYPGGGMSEMSSSGGPGKGGMGAGMEGGEGYGPAMGGAKPNQKKNPTEEQPKEVKNARRIAHQRFERIHLALNGAPRKPTTALAASSNVDKALVALISAEEKVKVTGLLAKVELFQEELNDHNIKDLSSLTIAVTKSVKELRVACDLILGEKKTVVSDTEDDPF